MKVLVLGGAGYVGSEAAWHLVDRGHEVVIYDDLSRGHARSVAGLPLVEASLHDGAAMRAVMGDERIDAVMHFAAYALVAESVADPMMYYHNNVAGSLTLLGAMRAAGVGHLVFSSTCATYGTPDTVPIPDHAPQRPVNPYGYTKLIIERALADHARAYGMSFVALRYFNAAGAAEDGSRGEDHDPETHAIPIALQVALGQRDRFMIFGDDYPTPDGTCVRDYIHITDLARAHELALRRTGPGRGLFVNLGTGHGHSVQQIVEAARRVTGHAIPTEIAERRPGDPPELVADPGRAREELGWKAEITGVDEIVRTAWRWHRAHPAGYADA
ncbi:MAG TPA: UDP-glucose 4-epimerase GalE [Euzebyales bacterium]